MRVQILRALLVLLLLGAKAHAEDRDKSRATGRPPGVPAAGPDSAPLPDDVDSPAYDAIRQRCALAIDRRACIEAARHAPRLPTPDGSRR